MIGPRNLLCFQCPHHKQILRSAPHRTVQGSAQNDTGRRDQNDSLQWFFISLLAQGTRWGLLAGHLIEADALLGPGPCRKSSALPE